MCAIILLNLFGLKEKKYVKEEEVQTGEWGRVNPCVNPPFGASSSLSLSRAAKRRRTRASFFFFLPT